MARVRIPGLVVLSLLLHAAAQGQTPGQGARVNIDTTTTTTSTDLPTVPTRPWYDTLAVTRPRYAYASPEEQMALAAFTAVSIPIGVVVGATTLLPPSVNVLRENGISRTGLAVSTGFALVRDTSAFIFFPPYRIQLEGGYYIGRSPGIIVRAAALYDIPLVSVHRKDFFWLAAAGGAGISTDFRSAGPYVETWAGVLNPMGIRYLTMFPMHNYGLRARYGYDPAIRRAWYELSIGATSTFWF